MEIKQISSSVGNFVQPAPVKDVDENTKVALMEPQENMKQKEKLVEEQKMQQDKPKKQEVDQAVSNVNSFFQDEQRKLLFTVNKETGDVVIEVKDAQTDEVIKLIPPEFVVKLAEHLNQLNESGDTVGMLVKEQA
jgi:flagellar protein FlaG